MFGPKKKNPLKKKPFVSTTKRVTTFGTPPPLPPVIIDIKEINDKKIQENEDIIENEDNNNNKINNNNHNNHHNNNNNNNNEIENNEIEQGLSLLKLRYLSIRWLNLSITLWSMISRNLLQQIDRRSLRNFLTSMIWRLNGSISEDEFHWLYTEWMQRNFQNHKQQISTLYIVREFLLEEKINEDSLEVFLGMIIFEANKSIFNTTITFTHTHSIPSSLISIIPSTSTPTSTSTSQLQSHTNIEVCSTRWINLSEELFFLLDSNGYGYISFDELFFFTICLLIGKNDWKDEYDIDIQLSISNITSIVINLLQQTGIDYPINLFHKSDYYLSNKSEKSQISKKYHNEKNNENYQNNKLVNNYCIINLPLFKNLLINLSIGETTLGVLLPHIKESLNDLVYLSQEKGVNILNNACNHYDTIDNINDIIPPKLWSTCINTISGHLSGDNLPSIFTFLLTDGYCTLPLAYLLYANNNHDLALLYNYINDIEINNDTISQITEENYDEIMNYYTLQLYQRFLSWGESSETKKIDKKKISDIKDSTFQLIKSILIEYKLSLQFLCAAFYDIVIEKSHEKTNGVSLNSIVTSLLPESKDFLKPLSDIIQDISNKDIIDNNNNNNNILKSQQSIESTMINSVESTSIPLQQQQSTQTILQLQSQQQQHGHEHEHYHQKQVEGNIKNKQKSPEIENDINEFEDWLRIEETNLLNLQNHKDDTWTTSINQELSNVIWATVFDYRDSIVGYPKFQNIQSPTSTDTSSTTINFSERRRRRRKFRHSSNNNNNNNNNSFHSFNSTTSNQSNHFLHENQSKQIKIQENYHQSYPVYEEIKTIIQEFPQKIEINNLVNNDNVNNINGNNLNEKEFTYHDTEIQVNPNGKEYNSPQIHKRNYDQDEFYTPEIESLPSSVEELLERGQSPGQYAQSLRDLLRKMSSKDSTIQLKSLEKIIQLGNTILETDEIPNGQVIQAYTPKKVKKVSKIPSPKESALLLGGKDIVISAKKNVPGIVPKSRTTSKLNH